MSQPMQLSEIRTLIERKIGQREQLEKQITSKKKESDYQNALAVF